jgi:rhomboid family protein
MGIYDRDYYRKEGPSYIDSLVLRGQVCKWLLLINVLVFVLQLASRNDNSVTLALALVPERVLSGEIWRLLTYAFLHDPNTWAHIVFNMWALWLYGDYVENIYGPKEFLAFYLTSAIVGGLAFTAQAYVGWNLTPDSICLGASGAVMAVMILCACHFPHLTILLFFIVPVPIWIVAGMYVIQNTFGLVGGARGVAFSVHLGGALFAALYYKSQTRILALLPSLRSWKLRLPRSRPPLRVYRGQEELPEPVAVPAGPLGQEPDEHLEAKLDAVLEKVARSGQASLTESEKQILLRASEIYKKKRT